MHEPPKVVIPDKRYFKIGEVSSLTGLRAYVLRFWETEFHQISPLRTRSGQRLYRRQDVETILKIRELLYERKYTIPGAREYLKQDRARKTDDTTVNRSDLLEEIYLQLSAIRALLKDP